MNTRLDELIKGFKPRFGSTEDINLVNRIGKIYKLRESVGKYESRVKSLTRAVNKQTDTQKRLGREENSLIAQLETRNGTAQS